MKTKPNPEDLIVFQMTPETKPKGWKKEYGTFGWKGDELYVPASAVGLSGDAAILACIFDGASICYSGKLILVPESWARQERPHWSDVFDAIRAKAITVKP